MEAPLVGSDSDSALGSWIDGSLRFFGRKEGFKGSKAVRGKWVDGSDWLATAAEEAIARVV